MSWRGPWLSLVLLCSVGAALAQLPPRGITPTPRATPRPTSTPVPAPTTPAAISPTPTGIWTQWRVTVEYRETPDGPWTFHSTQQEAGTDKKTMTLTLWRYK